MRSGISLGSDTNTKAHISRGQRTHMSLDPNQIPKPDKQQVRDYIERRSKERTPPPTPEDIRRQLGWGVLGK